MASIEECEKSMTVFYSKQTGDIKAISGGFQTMDFFGENKVDFEIIYDFKVVERDEYVIDNINVFKIEDEKLKLKETRDLSKYL